MLLLLMSYCCASEEKDRESNQAPMIDYVKFANFLNWKDKLPETSNKQGSERNNFLKFLLLM